MHWSSAIRRVRRQLDVRLRDQAGGEGEASALCRLRKKWYRLVSHGLMAVAPA